MGQGIQEYPQQEMFLYALHHDPILFSVFNIEQELHL